MGMKKLANTLDEISNGQLYDGKVLSEAYSIPELSQFERAIIQRYINGGQSSSDRFRLQEIAIKIRGLVK
jgi:hypothetical protein